MTRRVVSVWLNRWLTDRRERQQTNSTDTPPKLPLAIIEKSQGGERLIAVNEAAEKAGLGPGLLLTDARAIFPALKSLPAEPERERADLDALARWYARYSPWVSPQPPDGLMLDVTGVAHLFGGEAELLAHLRGDLQRLMLGARLALADTPGAAWAFARYGGKDIRIIEPGRQKEALAPLPVRALRISSKHASELEKLGLKRIGQLYDMPPGTLRPRFGKILSLRMAQALGTEKEAISPLLPEPRYFASARFPEPIGLLSDVEAIAGKLTDEVAHKLAHHGKAARAFLLTLYGAAGDCFSLTVKTAAPSKGASHIKRLFKERLKELEYRFDPAFGADAFSLHAQEIECTQSIQADLAHKSSQDQDITLLIDRLTARLGQNAVYTLRLRESHIPERGVTAQSPLSPAQADMGEVTMPRPLLLLPRPELIHILAEIPDYPPRRFEWRKLTFHVVRAEGPERIAAEWWRQNPDATLKTRDYFRVEDETGARFWLFRLGLFGQEEAAPQWFLHGVFA